MKIRPKQESPTLSKLLREQRKAMPPNKGVLLLPPETVQEAQAVQTKSGDGRVTRLSDAESADLIEAATMRRNDVMDVDFNEVEATASQIQQDAERPAETLFAEPAEVTHANGVIDVVFNAQDNIAAALKQAKLRLIAFGNDVLDWWGVVSNQAKMRYLKYRDRAVNWATNTSAQWSVTLAEAKSKVDVWLVKQAEIAEARRPISAAAFRLAMDEFAERLAMREEWNAAKMEELVTALKVAQKRIGTLEAAVRKNIRAVNRTAPTEAAPDDLKLFGLAISDGRKANAVDLYRKITGADLAAAKSAVAEIAT